jgi:hypothetical protein
MTAGFFLRAVVRCHYEGLVWRTLGSAVAADVGPPLGGQGLATGQPRADLPCGQGQQAVH